VPHTLTLRFRLRNPQLLRELMKHTGDGTRTTVRELADVAGVHHSFIGKLLAGDQETVTIGVAAAISGRIGVDLLILWSPVERADTAARPALEQVAV
jgi:transcriptional regulator with XRE-family HTH domain